MDYIHKKYNNLINTLANFKSVCVAFSAGVDSTFLLFAAKEALCNNVIAVTAALYSYPDHELNESINFCEKWNITHSIISIDEFSIPEFSKNPVNRCYYCKHRIFSEIIEYSKNKGINVVIEGSNTDDDNDFRPGMHAIKELKVLSPLRDTGFSKADIRTLSQEFKLPTWNKPNLACLSTRIPHREMITKEKLSAIEASESFLFGLGFSQVRVRHHGKIARIELLPEEFEKILNKDLRNCIAVKLKALGFEHVTLDISGYSLPSMTPPPITTSPS